MVGRAPREGANRSFRRSSRAANRANRVHRNKDPRCPTRGNDASRTFPCLFVAGPFGASGEAELAPTDDAVLDQPVAGFRDFLLLPTFGLGELARIFYGDGGGEAVGQLNHFELFLDGLAQCEVIDAAQGDHTSCPVSLRPGPISCVR